jgi:hypothetical protein
VAELHEQRRHLPAMVRLVVEEVLYRERKRMLARLNLDGTL